MEINWTEFKAFVTSRSLSIQWVVYGNNYHMKAFDGYFTLSCILPINSEIAETLDFEANFKANGNKTPIQKSNIVSMPDSSPFAAPTFRTKRHATASFISGNPGTMIDIDFILPAERYVSGGTVIVENAELGDYVIATVEDPNGVIPLIYQAALCEAYPIVSTYIEKEFIEVMTPGSLVPNSITIHDVSTLPLTAKITQGLCLCIKYYAVNSGLPRRVGVNYHFTKKL